MKSFKATFRPVFALVLLLLLMFSACDNRSSQEIKEDTQVNSILQNDQQKADSMKRALGIE